LKAAANEQESLVDQYLPPDGTEAWRCTIGWLRASLPLGVARSGHIKRLTNFKTERPEQLTAADVICVLLTPAEVYAYAGNL